jgi:nicotinate-nucleotide adenylyltransferase
MDIGVFGGTFDPIHIGHLIVAEEVRIKIGLGEVIFVPTGQPWLKANRPVSSAVHRLEMVRLAIITNPYFKLSTIEVDRPGPSYTVDTMAILQQQLGAETRFFFLLGSDALAELPQWKEPSRLIQMCHLVVFTRPGAVLSLKSLESAIPGISQRVIFVDVPQIDISATQIRQRVAQGASIRYIIPEAVERYILEHKLYKID